MLNIKWLLVFCVLWLSGCNALGPPELGPDGKPLPKIYKLKRQFLHAKTLGFTHPSTKKPMIFSSLLPKDLNNILKMLRNTEE